MKKKSLVAFYGEKPKELYDLLSGIIDRLQKSGIRESYIPYEMDQMHGTLAGMESIEIEGKRYNRNLWMAEGRKMEMNIGAISEILNRHFPMQIRFGGFSPSFQTFLSRGEKPYRRSFGINRSDGKVLVMGWPHRNDDFSDDILLKFREELRSACNIGHKYAGDNDFYMVIGEYIPGKEIDTCLISEVEDCVRKSLADLPTDITINDCYIVTYHDPRLPLESTEAILFR
jgi:hypothetical protein